MVDKKDQMFVPANYEELYLHYIEGANSLCRSILRTKLPKMEESEREAFAHDVFIRLQRHNAIDRHDPKLGNFGGQVFSATRSVIGNWMNQRQRNALEGLKQASLVSSFGNDEEFEPGTISLENLFTEDPRMEAKTDAVRQVQKMATYAKACSDNPANSRDKNMWTLFQMLLDGCDPQECSKALGVTNSTVHNYVAVLKLQSQL